MSNPDNMPLYIKTYKLLKYLYFRVKNFKKEYKYTLGNDILAQAWDVLDNIVRANAQPNCEKFQLLKEASISFDKLKMRLRMAHELGLISHKQYAFIINQTTEIGKMLNGWYLWSEKLSSSVAKARI